MEILVEGQPRRRGFPPRRSFRYGRIAADVWDSERVLFVEYGPRIPTPAGTR
ncbi:hypothetical protein V6U90_31935 [Micromonospora sp. CPCC 206060]|uniref:hypothetical protein n=1 Tax=Micromonospora sp. CPCC 206060 TaxID=3122406 RepID=UPI002FF12056